MNDLPETIVNWPGSSIDNYLDLKNSYKLSFEKEEWFILDNFTRLLNSLRWKHSWVRIFDDKIDKVFSSWEKFIKEKYQLFKSNVPIDSLKKCYEDITSENSSVLKSEYTWFIFIIKDWEWFSVYIDKSYNDVNNIVANIISIR